METQRGLTQRSGGIVAPLSPSTAAFAVPAVACSTAATSLICGLEVAEGLAQTSRRIDELEKPLDTLLRGEEIIKSLTVAPEWAEVDAPLECILRALQHEVQHRLFRGTAPRAALRVRAANCV